MAALEAAINLLNWDQQVLMPAGGAAARSEHVQILKRRLHALQTSDELLRAVETAEAGDDALGRDKAAAIRRDLGAQGKIPLELVARKARVSSEAYDAWRTAKPENDFARMRPYYAELFAIARETADAIGFTDHPYDALIGLFEYGATYRQAADVFATLKPAVQRLVQEIVTEGRPLDDTLLQGPFDDEALRGFAQSVTAKIGFDYDRGRLDLCRNAFCTHADASDIRMTTRPSGHFRGVFSSSLHEMGHALYEQRIDPEYAGTALGGGISLAVHESQSRLWENVIARSLGFWRYFAGQLGAVDTRLESVTPERMFEMMNVVRPEFVRVGSDELTYNLHILVRFELEVELVSGQLDIRDLPDAWNAKYTEYLGITPPSDTLGCLQDVHWSRGSVGYFPTYTFGNLIGAQIWETLVSEIGDPESSFAQGEFGSVLDWLTDKVYQHGRRYEPEALVTRITGKPFAADAWIRYAEGKYRTLYKLS